MTEHVDKKQKRGGAPPPAAAPHDASAAATAGNAQQGQQNSEGSVLNVFKVPGLVVTSHSFTAPLDYSGQVPGVIELFAREVCSPNNVNNKRLPYLVYLQGGPGFEAPRPTEASGWLKSAVNHYRVVLLDQRGTGRSSGITTLNLSKRGTPEQQAQYLSFFRADSIVKDAELVRELLVPRDTCGGKWAVLGQSFGGFCAFTYLSFASKGLLEVMLTGGIPPGVDQPCSAEAVYRALYRRVIQANRRYYARFPRDADLVHRIVRFLQSQPGGYLTLPGGTHLTPRLLQTLGLSGLGSGGGFERLHYLLESFFDSEQGVSPSFIKTFEAHHSWDTNPLYALLHESIYCQGSASLWAAHRVRQEQEFSATFDVQHCMANGMPVFFTGEMVFPWLFEDVAPLRPYKQAADLLAAKSDWGPLYDVAALRGSQVPSAAATYVEDMYVDYDLAQGTARHLPVLRQWQTNEYKHSGIRDDGARIFERLLHMVRDNILLE